MTLGNYVTYDHYDQIGYWEDVAINQCSSLEKMMHVRCPGLRSFTAREHGLIFREAFP